MKRKSLIWNKKNMLTKKANYFICYFSYIFIVLLHKELTNVLQKFIMLTVNHHHSKFVTQTFSLHVWIQRKSLIWNKKNMLTKKANYFICYFSYIFIVLLHKELTNVLQKFIMLTVNHHHSKFVTQTFSLHV